MIFVSTKYKKVVVTNYKVMFSTLNTSDNYQEIRFLKAITFLLNPTYTNYFLTRSPYNRLESFYKDKLEIHLNPSKWQYCQRVIINTMGWQHFSESEIIKKLSNMDYETFILNLEKYYIKDLHMTPQYLTIKKGGIYFGNHIQKIDIDNPKGKEKIKNELLKVNKVHNSTPHRAFRYTAQMLDIIHRLYSKDFKYLGYEKSRKS